MNQIGGRAKVWPLRACNRSGSEGDAMAALKAAQALGLKPLASFYSLIRD
jgi:hypothetical protein